MTNQFKRWFLLATLFCVLIPAPMNAAPASFVEAKKFAKVMFGSNRETLYCACKYNQYNEVDLASCNMQSAAPIKRAHRVEWEHMMPAENFGRQFVCWREPVCSHHGKPFKGRKCCEKSDPKFRQVEAELYNLWPAVGLVNQARSNYRYAVLDSTSDFYGCDFKVDRYLRKVEPADRAKGIVARANLFMADKYNIELSASQRQLFIAWSKQFPPSTREKNWAAHVAEIEGYPNPYIGTE